MKIEVYIMARNEERIIPYLMRHYGRFAKVIFLESNSTDKTVSLARSLGGEVWKYNISDEVDDRNFLRVKESCWQGSKADWAIVVDADEFVYHPDIVGELKKSKATIIHPKFYNMFSEIYPTTEGQIYDEVKLGTDGDFWLSKMNIFRPSDIKRMNWIPGCHGANPEGNVIIDADSEIKTLHMRFLSREFLIHRYEKEVLRLSQHNLDNGFGIQFHWTAQQINDYFDKMKPNLKQIV